MPNLPRRVFLPFAGILAAALLAALPAITVQPAAGQSEDVLGRLRPGHPRLYVVKEDITGIRETMKRDPAVQAWYARLQEEAGKMLDEPPVEHKLIGPRLLQQSRNALRRISTLAGLYRLDGDRRKAERARQEMLTAAAFPDWNPSHFLDTAEMTNALAVGYDWLFDFLSAEDRAAIRKAIVEKGLQQGMEAYLKGVRWTKRSNNWNQVCNGGLNAGALAIADQEPELAREIINRARASIMLEMPAFAPDGGDEEGPGYWSYATRYTVFYLAGVQSALGTDFGIKQSPGFAETGTFRMHSSGPLGLAFNYADAGARAGAASQMIWFAREFNRPIYARHERMMAGDRPEIFHLLWSRRAMELPRDWDFPLDAVYRGVNVAFFRSAWGDAHAAYLGFKGGDNRASHSHLDLGTFVFDAQGERWAVDLAGDDYNLPQYFGKLRWTYYRLRTEGHNTLVIDGQNQDPKGKAPLAAFVSTPNRAYAVADLTGGYQPKVSRALRGVALLNRRQLLVQDEVEAPEPVDIVWNFHTPATIDLGNTRAMLSKGGAKMEARILSPEGARFEVISANPAPPQGRQPDVQNLIIRLPEKVRRTRIAVLIAPPGALSAPPLEPLDSWITRATRANE